MKKLLRVFLFVPVFFLFWIENKERKDPHFFPSISLHFLFFPPTFIHPNKDNYYLFFLFLSFLFPPTTYSVNWKAFQSELELVLVFSFHIYVKPTYATNIDSNKPFLFFWNKPLNYVYYTQSRREKNFKKPDQNHYQTAL